ncbi:P-loop NTPase fold protein [Tsuneonella troitsensis]|uniref:P-loop NTPase fold protein n=1 Tax=Tsuneonella troitsensis TaxID=292222 RepID=UPI00070BFCE1|nr:P-loop NTPase fold protein [Tsuneonella troitsensis]
MDPNKHVEDYLTYYVGMRQEPRYAVLLNGAWGTGKTFFVQNLMSRLARPNGTVYVSLYGLKSTEEIDQAVLRAVYPIVGTKIAQLGGHLVRAALKFGGVDTDVGLTDVLPTDVDKVFIFDDLERAQLEPNQTLGYINEFVEQMGRKVLIIANEAEITAENYRFIREKVIGKTLLVKPALNLALTSFVGEVSDAELRDLVLANSSLIEAIFIQSGTNNLRILQQTLWDFERAGASLTAEMRECEEGVRALVGLFFALSFEVKSGRLAADVLSKRSAIVGPSGWIRSAPEDHPIRRAIERYPEVNLGDQILSDEVLENILVNGSIDVEQIRSTISRSTYYVTSSEEPAWRTVWYGWERSEAEFEGALKTFEQQVQERAITEPGEIVHMFGLRLWLSEIGELSAALAEVTAEGKTYVDDLYKARNLEPLPAGADDDLRYGGWGGLQIRSLELQEMKELWAYFREKRAAAAEEELPSLAQKLLAELVKDPDLFERRISPEGGDDSTLARVPVMTAMPVNELVAAMLQLHPAKQWRVFAGLRARYEHGAIDRRFPEERAWMKQFAAHLRSAVLDQRPLTRDRLTRQLNALVELIGSDPGADPFAIT